MHFRCGDEEESEETAAIATRNHELEINEELLDARRGHH